MSNLNLTLKVYKEARELISTPDKWTQGAYARKTNGLVVDPNSPEAVCFCSLGAIFYAQKTLDAMSNNISLNPIFHVTNFNIVEFNDFHTHEEVLVAWDKAIAYIEQLIKDNENA